MTLDELAEDEDEVGGRSDTIGTRSFHVQMFQSVTLTVLKHLLSSVFVSLLCRQHQEGGKCLCC